MRWLPEGDEREQVHRALLFGEVQWKGVALDFAIDLGCGVTASGFVQLAAEEVGNSIRRVQFQDENDEALCSNSGTEQRWYAVELRCDGQVLFFKFAFLKGSERNLKVVSFHKQLTPWKY